MRLFLDGEEWFVGTWNIDGTTNITGNIVLTGGGTIESTANGDIQLLPNGTGITQVGDAGSTSHGLAANDDFFASGKFENDGPAWFDGEVSFGTTVNHAGANVWTGNHYLGLYYVNDDGAHISVNQQNGIGNNNLILTTAGNFQKDHDHDTDSVDPTFIIHSGTNPDTNNTQWVSSTHNRTDALYKIGVGSKATNHEAPVSLADEASFSLPNASTGYGTFLIGDSEEYAHIAWAADGTVTLIVNSANVVTTDTDTKFCIFDNGTSVSVKNRLGSAKEVMFDYHYTT